MSSSSKYAITILSEILWIWKSVEGQLLPLQEQTLPLVTVMGLCISACSILQ